MNGEAKRGIGGAWVAFLTTLGIMILTVALNWEDHRALDHAETMAGEVAFWIGRLFVLPLIAAAIVLVSRLFRARSGASTND